MIDKRSKQIRITDHALVRWIERVKGVNLDSIRKEILSSGIPETINELGNKGIFPFREFKVVVRERTLITFLLPGQKISCFKKPRKYGKRARKNKESKARIANKNRNKSDS